ncbi:MAG: hypothetical protein M0R17_03900 [Candidatus Omnitrophica bacterium]|jgi:hypothetical protein|nr:hypothetical protein [Candidatus Omnitrophota bacterium]
MNGSALLGRINWQNKRNGLEGWKKTPVAVAIDILENNSDYYRDRNNTIRKFVKK